MRASIRAKLQLDKAGTFSKKEIQKTPVVQDEVVEKNLSSMDSEELNMHFEQLGDILGSDVDESGSDIYASSYLESMSHF